jgi:integrase/recombinase XerD
MAKPIRLRPAKNPSGKGYRLSIPAKLSGTGRRQQLFFPTKTKAEDYADRIKAEKEEFGLQARAISPALAETAIMAANILKPWGITILEAAQRIADMEAETAASVTMETALEAFKLAKESKSAKQTQAIKHMAAHLAADFSGRQLSTIKGEEIAKHLTERTSGPHAFNAKRRLYITFWRWSAKPPREWCKADTLQHVERQEAISGEIGTLNAEEVSRLLTAAETYFPDTVIPFAISIFTGMRQAELERLVPADITAEGINIPAVNDRKNKRRRFIEIPEPLAPWLKKYQIQEIVIPPNWPRKYDAVRRLAGWKIWSDLVPHLPITPPIPEAAPEDAPEWPQNAIRHTSASAALALGKTLQQLIFEHGHTEGVETLRGHYIGKMTKKEALKIWSLRPGGKVAKTQLKTVKGAA